MTSTCRRRTEPPRRTGSDPCGRIALTLVELLVVIAIILVLMALLLPAVQSLRESGRRLHCGNSLKQLALGCLAFEVLQGALPPGTVRNEFADGGRWAVTPAWIARILPYMDQKPLFDRIDWTQKPGDEGANVAILDIPLPGVRCPSDSTSFAMAGWAPTNYVASVGNTDRLLPWDVEHPGAFYIAWDSVTPPPVWAGQQLPVAVDGRKLDSIRDGLSRTLLLGECVVNWPPIKRYTDGSGYEACLAGTQPPLAENDTKWGGRGRSWFMGAWSQVWTFSTRMTPNDPLTAGRECEFYTHQGHYATRSRHPGGSYVALADGSLLFADANVDIVAWQAMGSVAGGETLDVVP